MKSHYTIPFFIPHAGCGFACVFCAQKKITGKEASVTPDDIGLTIERYLTTMPDSGICKEVGFFGGSFTGLPREEQVAFLREVQPFIDRGDIDAIRLSTRPDYIDRDVLTMLKDYHVVTIELGVQSLCDEVLSVSKRGHTAEDIARASRCIRDAGFVLAHQMMVGLPRSTVLKEFRTARASVALGAREVRVYPVVVIAGTELAEWRRQGEYMPLGEEEAVKRCAGLIKFFEQHDMKVLRCGLHPSEGLLSGNDICAGPFHQAFGQKARTYQYRRVLKKMLSRERDISSIKEILFHPREAGYVFGYERANAIWLGSVLNNEECLKADETVSPGELCIVYRTGVVKNV